MMEDAGRFRSAFLCSLERTRPVILEPQRIVQRVGHHALIRCRFVDAHHTTRHADLLREWQALVLTNLDAIYLNFSIGSMDN